MANILTRTLLIFLLVSNFSTNAAELSTSKQIQQLYIAYLGRAADPAGLEYWTGEVDAGLITLDQIRVNLVNEQPEYLENYGQLSNFDLTNKVYENLFNREADVAGRDYWVGQLDAGLVLPDQLIIAFINGASEADKVVVANKLFVAECYTNNTSAYSDEWVEQLLTQQGPDAALDTCPAGDSGAAAKRFGMEVDSEEVALDPDAFFSNAAANGINWVSLEIFTLDGLTLLDTPLLTDAGFSLDTDYGNVFPVMLNAAKAHDIEIVVMLEGIGHIVDNQKPYDPVIEPDKLTPEMVSDLIVEIAFQAQQVGASVGVSEEAFSETYIDAIDQATAANMVEYTHFFDDPACRPDVQLSEDYAYYPRDATNNQEDKDYLREINELASYLGQLGHLDIMFGTAESCGAESGVATAGGWGFGAKTHQNIALLRAIQFDPKLYVYILAEGDEGAIFPEEIDYIDNYDFGQSLVPLIDEFGQKPGDIDKPLANLVLETPSADAPEDVQDFFNIARLSGSVITSSMLAAGFDLVVTDTPVESADLYYVLTAGDVFGESVDMGIVAANLVDGDTPVFYQIVGAAPETANFAKVFTALGFDSIPFAIGNENDLSTFEPIPEFVSVDFANGTELIRYAGYSLELWDINQSGEFTLGHYVHLISPNDVAEGTEVLYSANTSADDDGLFDDEIALLLRNGQVHLINGGYIHHAMTGPLANLMASQPIYNSESFGYLTSGPDRTAFFTPYETAIDINLLGGSQVTQFDADGSRLTTPTVAIQGNRLIGTVGKFHLVVVN